jgi:signal transduction histidine kinase
MLPPREQALSTLHDATRELIAAETAESVCEIAVEASRDLLGNEFTGIHLFDEEGALVPVAWTGDVDRYFDGPPPTIGPGEGLVWETIETGEPRLYNRLHEQQGRMNADSRLRAEMQLPVGDHGVMFVGSTTSETFTPEEFSLSGVLAANVGAAIESVENRARLQDRETALERQNERLGVFASMVSHDLRNPLAVAVGQLELAREEGDNERLARVATALERMEVLIDDLLVLAREGRTTGEVRPVAPHVIAERAWQTVVTDGATLVVEETDLLEADPDALTEVFENLFRNAVEHGSTGSQPAADDAVEHGSTGNRTPSGDAVEHGDGNPTIEVGPLAGGFYVADDGPGIPPAERERVFEYGYTTSKAGTGLGLAIVLAIAESHGWEVTVTESEAGGARFEFRA